MNLLNTLAFSAYYDKRWFLPEILKCVPSISAWQITFHSKCQSNNEPSSFSWTALNKAEFRPCLPNSSFTEDNEKIQVITRLGWVCRHPPHCTSQPESLTYLFPAVWLVSFSDMQIFLAQLVHNFLYTLNAERLYPGDKNFPQNILSYSGYHQTIISVR